MDINGNDAPILLPEQLDRPQDEPATPPAFDVDAPPEDRPRFRIKSMRIPGEISPFAPQHHFRMTTPIQGNDEERRNDEGEPT